MSPVPVSDFFFISTGLKQGKPLYCLLFVFFINDTRETINLNYLTKKTNYLQYIYYFLPTIWIGPVSPQQKLNSTHAYSFGLLANGSPYNIFLRTFHKTVYFITTWVVCNTCMHVLSSAISAFLRILLMCIWYKPYKCP